MGGVVQDSRLSCRRMVSGDETVETGVRIEQKGYTNVKQKIVQCSHDYAQSVALVF